MLKNSRIDFYLGIDFGTTFSGVTVRKKGQNEVKYMKIAGEYGKVPTEILYKIENDRTIPQAYGEEAREKYFQSAAKDGDYVLLSKFKLKMLDISAKQKNIERPYGEYFTKKYEKVKVDLISATTDLFRWLMSETTKCFEDGLGLKVKNPCYVITVPGNANESYVGWIRTAANEAGMIDSPNDNQLMIAREPEAAMLYAMFNESIQKNYGDIEIERDGNKIFILDCGGGTVDYGAYEVENKDNVMMKLKPLHYSWAENCGGTFWNKNFEKILFKELGEVGGSNLDSDEDKINLGKAIKEKLSEKVPEFALAWHLCIMGFESSKRMFGGDSPVQVNLAPIKDIIKENESNMYQELVKKKILDPYGIYPWIINEEVMKREICAPIINQIERDVLAILDDKKIQVNTLMFTGGFSNSSYLKKELKRRLQKKFEEYMEVPRASVAVEWGASYHAEHPDILTARILTCGYAFSSSQPYREEDVGHEWKISDLNSVKYCTERLFICLKKGQKCENKANLHMGVFTALFKKQKRMTFGVYRVDNEDAEYIDADGVCKLGEFTVEIQDDKEEVNVYCIFKNNTEIEFYATNGSGVRCNERVPFNWAWKEKR